MPDKFIVDPKKYYASIAKKPIGAGVLFFDRQGRLLILKPSYKDCWSIPGGVVDKCESPLAAAKREAYEEIGIVLKMNKLICVDHLIHEERSKLIGRPVDSLQFLFFGGYLSDKQIKKIKIDSSEIEEYRFLEIKKALSLFSKGFRKRLQCSLKALRKSKVVYLENGEEI